jgi:peptidoglycan/xylan/chitin deacetylase (PgdA/CDA1 family)
LRAPDMIVDPIQQGEVGTLQYATTLPLQDGEIVLTFDDGPSPEYTPRVLDALAVEGVKATFFLIGAMARRYPALVCRICHEGHTIASHTQNHPLPFTRVAAPRARQEIETGILSIAGALAGETWVAPFFRFPGLGRCPRMEAYLKERSFSIWSADFAADDWKNISAMEVVARVRRQISRKRKGVLLLHDIQRRTALALPILLKTLKADGYRIVHAIPLEGPRSIADFSIAISRFEMICSQG